MKTLKLDFINAKSYIIGLNNLVLLYKCNCIRIMSINTYNKNVDTI